MPRTIFKPGKAMTGDLRHIAERFHRYEQERFFQYPLTIQPVHDTDSIADDSVDLTLRWEKDAYTMGSQAKARSALLPEDIRRFCFKDCALYLSGSHTILPMRDALFDYIYRRWYPCRADDVDISHGSFFCGLLEFATSTAPSLAQVSAFHSDLCSRLDRLVPLLEAPVTEPNFFGEIREDHALLLPPVEYRLRPTFRQCFIYISLPMGDRGIAWAQDLEAEHQAYVVFIREEDANMHTHSDNAYAALKQLPRLEHGLQRAAVFLCDSIQQAMHIVLAADTQRMTGQVETHSQYYDPDANEWEPLHPWPSTKGANNQSS